MNQIRNLDAAHALAIYAMYIMNGYNEAAADGSDPSELQEQVGHIGVADAITRLAGIVGEYLASPYIKALGEHHPGVFEYEILEPLGKWLHGNSKCTSEEFRAELDRRFRAWMADERLQAVAGQMELARNAVKAKMAYRAALRELEIATTGREGEWSRPVRIHVEEYIDIVGHLAHLHPTSPLEALLAVAGGKF